MVNVLRGLGPTGTPQREALPPKAVTAAVATVRMDAAAWKTYSFGDVEWQTEAWRHYDINGQLRFVANWAGNSVSRCRLYVAATDDNGEATEETDDPTLAGLAAGPLGAGPAKDESLRLLGINLFVVGEAWVIAEADGIAPGQDRWFVVAGRKIRKQGDTITVERPRLHGGGKMTYRDGVDLMLRVWTPHPADTDQADSPARSALPDLREIEALRKREFAELDSRLSGAGLLGLPEEVQLPHGPNDPPGVQGFAQLLMRAMATSLADRSSAEAMVPIMFTAPAEALDKMRHITFWSELSAQILPMRREAVTSLAQSLDVPPEVLVGLGGSNHWSAWAISEEAVTTQIVPLLNRIADALTTGYLRPALAALRMDEGSHVYAFDTAPLTTRPNRSADALTYHERGLISDEATRQAGAFTPGEAPEPVERVRRLIERAVKENPALLAEPVVQQVLGVEGIIPAATPALEGNPPPAPEGERQPAQQGPPEPTPQTEGGGPGGQTPTSGQAATLVAVAKLSVMRALALAGGRLVPHRLRDRWPTTPRHQLHARHGLVTRDQAETLLRGAWDDLPAVAEDAMVNPAELRAVLHDFCLSLLTRGIAYDPALLRDMVLRANLGPAPAAIGTHP